MQTETTIAFHLGAPQTDNEQLTLSIRKDKELMSKHSVLMRRPKEFRGQFSIMLAELDGNQPTVSERDGLLATLLGGAEVKRLIMSNPAFMGVPAWMFYGGNFYENAGKNTAMIRNLFPDNPCEFFLGIANPATFIPAVFNSQKDKSFERFIDDADMAMTLWSDVIERIQNANPNCPITVWANEDTPVIWPTVLREVAGMDPDIRLKGELDIIREIISNKGFRMLEEFLKQRPQLTEKQRCKVRELFLEKFYIEEAVVETIDLPDWGFETVEALTQIYEDDLETIQNMPNVKFLSIPTY